MNPLRLVTLTTAVLITWAPGAARAAAPVPGAWGQSAQEKAAAAQSADEAARAAREAARASSQAVKETVREAMKEVDRHQAWGAGEPRGETFGDKLAKVVKVPENPTVLVQGFSGDITVSAGAAGEVRVEASKRLHGAAGADPKAGENARVSIEERAGRVEVRAWTPRGWKGIPIDFNVVVPASSTVELKSLSGDITVSGVKGGVVAESMSGNISATSLASGSTLKSVSGDVSVSGGAVAGDVTASSVSGDVMAKGLKVKALNAASVSGNVAVQNSSCDRATVNSVSGNLEVGGPLNKSARYELKSHSGDVRVVVDGKTGFEVDASTWSGSISNDLGIKGADAGDTPGPGPKHKTLRGVYGDGSAQIEVASFSGNVVIAKVK